MDRFMTYQTEIRQNKNYLKLNRLNVQISKLFIKTVLNNFASMF